MNIYVADGGEDGRIEWTGGPESTPFLPSRLVQFQNKATKLEPARCANAIVGKDRRLKPTVESALDNGGAYIMFTTTQLTHDQKIACIDALKNTLKLASPTPIRQPLTSMMQQEFRGGRTAICPRLRLS